MKKALRIIMTLLAVASAIVALIGAASIESETLITPYIMLFGGLISLYLIGRFYFKIA